MQAVANFYTLEQLRNNFIQRQVNHIFNVRNLSHTFKAKRTTEPYINSHANQYVIETFYSNKKSDIPNYFSTIQFPEKILALDDDDDEDNDLLKIEKPSSNRKFLG